MRLGRGAFLPHQHERKRTNRPASLSGEIRILRRAQRMCSSALRSAWPCRRLPVSTSQPVGRLPPHHPPTAIRHLRSAILLAYLKSSLPVRFRNRTCWFRPPTAGGLPGPNERPPPIKKDSEGKNFLGSETIAPRRGLAHRRTRTSQGKSGKLVAGRRDEQKQKVKRAGRVKRRPTVFQITGPSCLRTAERSGHPINPCNLRNLRIRS